MLAIAMIREQARSYSLLANRKRQTAVPTDFEFLRILFSALAAELHDTAGPLLAEGLYYSAGAGGVGRVGHPYFWLRHADRNFPHDTGRVLVEYPRVDALMPQHVQHQVGIRQVEGIHDPGNLGSILRSTAAAGVDHVFLSKDCVFAWSPRVIRAGQGAHFLLSIHEGADLAGLAGNFPGRVVATGLSATTNLFDTDLTGPLALLIGNEGAGLSEELLTVASHRVRIPMPGGMESLNVAAAAICLFERVRQATQTG